MGLNLTPRTPSAASATTYPLFFQGKKSGPFSQTEILIQFADGKIGSDAMVKKDDVWTSLTDLGWVPSAVPSDSDTHAQEKIPEPEFAESDTIVTCAHCWHKFRMSQINFISKHIELTGDPVLGPEAQRRFLPTAFNEQGYAIDARGMVCQDMACPNCHLKIPEALVDTPSTLFSIVGAPASGKSYYLTAMIWQARNILAKQFDYTLADTDVSFNSVLNHYESILFLNRRTDEYVSLPKTELQGNDFSNQILLNGMSVDLPLPFIFSLIPMPSNPHFKNPRDGMRNIILYDNAGEHFEPGRDTVTNLATQHLVVSDSITFLYDPIKDSRMVTQCDSADPQVSQVDRGANQLVLLNEMIGRIKKYAGLKSKEKYKKLLIVAIPKYDAWRNHFPVDLEKTNVVYYNEGDMNNYLDVGVVTSISFVMREQLLKVSPEVVATCESFFTTVYFVPLSSLGRIPEYDSKKDMIAIKPEHIKPIWAEVPLLLQFYYSNLIGAVASGVPSFINIEKYRFTEDSLIYTLPGGRERKTVPENYWGRVVFSTKLNQYIRFPTPEVQEPEPNPADASVDDFWRE